MKPDLEGQPIADPPRRPFLKADNVVFNLDERDDLLVSVVDEFGDAHRGMIRKETIALVVEWLCMLRPPNVVEVEETYEGTTEFDGKYATRRGWKVRSSFLGVIK